MKKFSFILSALLISLTSMLTACFSNDIPEIVIHGGSEDGKNSKEVKIEDEDIHQEDTYSYTVLTNVVANISVDGVRKTKSNSYQGSAKIGTTINITAKAEATGYYSGELTKTVVLDTPGKVINFYFAKNETQGGVSPYDKLPYSITVIDAKEETEVGNVKYVRDTIEIKNTSANRTEPYGAGAPVDALMKIAYQNASNVLNANSNYKDSLFTITAKNLEITNIKESLGDADEWFSVLDLHCTPDGAQFGSNPMKVQVKNKYFENDMSFKCEGALNGVTIAKNGGTAYLEFAHFSDYDIQAHAIVQFQSETEVVVTNSYFAVNVGQGDYKYVVNTGYQCDYSGKNGFIDKYLNAKFGCRKKLVERSVNITNMSAKASVPYVTYQKIRKYNVYFGEVKLDVYVYGEDRIVVKNSEAVSWTEVRHSGLSAE